MNCINLNLSAGTESPSIRQLNWNIKVDIHQALAEKVSSTCYYKIK
jgi:hypothetical protein